MRTLSLSKILVAALAFLVAMTLSACFGGTASEPTRYYTLAVENIDMPKGSPKGKVQVRKFSIDPAYQRTNMVYRESAYDFMFYDLDLWASRPEHVVMQVVSEYAIKSGIFESVETKGSATAKPDYEILGNIIAIEEVDEGSSQYARLAMELTFQKVEGEPLWQKRFDDKMSMEKREPRYMAESTSKLLAKFMEQALSEIGGAI